MGGHSTYPTALPITARPRRSGTLSTIASWFVEDLIDFGRVELADGTERRPGADYWLQVFYRQPRDTVDVLQIRSVFRRLNRFLRLITKTVGPEEHRSSWPRRIRMSWRRWCHEWCARPRRCGGRWG